MSENRSSKIGTLSMIICSIIFPLNTLNWAQVNGAFPLEVYSIKLSVIFLMSGLCLLFYKPARKDLRELFVNKRLFWLCVGFGLSMAARMMVYYSLVTNKSLYLDLSFASFVWPLMQIPITSLIFKEKLSAGSLIGLFLAAAAIIFLAIVKHTVPIFAIALSVTSTAYVIFKKPVKQNPVSVLWMENFVALPIAAATFLILGINGNLEIIGHAHNMFFTLLGSIIAFFGFVGLTLATQWAAAAAYGFISYIEPTIIFFLGLWLYKNPLDLDMLIAFIIIWIALAIYFISTFAQRRKNKKTKLAAASIQPDEIIL